MLGLGAVGSAIITHYAVETLRPCQGEASSLRAVDPVTMALAGEAGEPLKLIPMGVLPWKVGKDLKREPWVGGEAWASPLSCPDGQLISNISSIYLFNSPLSCNITY